jgi:Ca2+-binding EF-hand superfamily protein
MLINRLFELFTTPESPGMVSFDEVVSGLSVLCGGTHEDKMRAAFELYDINSDGFIRCGARAPRANSSRTTRTTNSSFVLASPASFEEMVTYLTSVFKVLFVTNDDIRWHWEEEMGVSAEQLGQLTAESAFEEADLNEDGRLSFEEFSIWYRNREVGDEDGEDYDPADYDVDSGGVHGTTMEEVQRITGLEDQHVEDVFELFASKVRKRARRFGWGGATAL